MEEIQQDNPFWAWPQFFPLLDDNINLDGYDLHDDPLALEGDSFLVPITQQDDQSLGAVPVPFECYHADVPTVDSQASSAGIPLTPEHCANIATDDQDFLTQSSIYDEGLARQLFDNAFQSSDTMSPPDLRFTNDASLWSPPTQDNNDPWIDNAGLPLDPLEFNSESNLGLDQGSLWGLNNGLCNDLLTEGAILDFPSKCLEFHPNELPGNCPESSSSDPHGSSPWSLLSSRSPCSESQSTNSWDPLFSQSPCPEPPISPGFPEPFYAPPVLSGPLVIREVPVEELISSTGDSMPGPFPFASIPTVSPIPEPRPNESHGQQTPPSRLKARERRKIELPEKCPVCHIGYQYKSLMKRHIRTQHKKYALKHKIAEDPFICEICGKGYSRSDHLYRHGRLEHGWPPRMRK